MKRACLLLVVLAATVLAQRITVPESAYTIAGGLPSASVNVKGRILITDGVSLCDTTIGGGSTYVLAISNGSSWVTPNCTPTGITFLGSCAGGSLTSSKGCNLSTSVSAGNVILVAAWGGGGGSAPTFTDNCNTGSSSDTYTVLDTSTSGAGNLGDVASAWATVGANTATCTVTATATSSSTLLLVAHVVSKSSSISLDSHAWQSQTAGNYSAANSITSGSTSVSGVDYVFGATLNTSGTLSSYATVGSGFTQRSQFTFNYYGTSEDTQTNTSKAATFTAPSSTSSTWTTFAIALK